MTEKQILLQELEEEFTKAKKKYAIQTTVEELQSLFLVKDQIMYERFVSETVLNQIRRRVGRFIFDFGGYLHGILVPNPQSLAQISESNFFSDEEKKKIMYFYTRIVKKSAKTLAIGFMPNQQKEAKMIDELVLFWKEIIPEVKVVAEKIELCWEQEEKKEKEQKKEVQNG